MKHGQCTTINIIQFVLPFVNIQIVYFFILTISVLLTIIKSVNEMLTERVITIDCDRELRLHLLNIDLPPDEFRVYVILIMLCIPLGKRWFNKQLLNQGECVISQQRIAERAGLERRRTQKVLDALKEKKLISVRNVSGLGCNIYTICAMATWKNIYEELYDRLELKVRNGVALDEDQQYYYDHLKLVYGKDFVS